MFAADSDTKAAHDFAATTHKGLPAHVAEVSNDTLRSYIPKAIKSKAAAWDDDKDTARKRSKGIESARKRVHPNSNVDEEVEEGTTMNTNEAKKNAKPDFLDLDKDGNKKEPMKKAAADKKKIDDKKKKAVKEAKMSPAEKAHHHATEYARHHKTGNLDLAMHHKENCEECGGMIQHGPMGECWHMHAGINKGRPYKVGMEGIMTAEGRIAFKDKSSLISESIATYIAEDEEGKAKAITAGADMVNDFTSWMQRVGNYQTKSMIELSDNIRANFGMQEAEAFKASVGQALEATLNALTTSREEINNAVAVLAGEAPAVEPMGQEPAMGGMPQDTAPMAGGGEEDSLNLPSADDEFAASDAAAGGMETAGRMKRESIERGNRLMKILGS